MLLSILLGVAALHVPAQQSEPGRKRFEEIKAKAEKGDAEAQYNLGQSYVNPDRVVRDTVEAVKWWRKAAEQGNAAAQNALAVCYAAGEGVPKDAVEAVKWFRKAAEQGSMKAQHNLGGCYATGQGCSAANSVVSVGA